MKSTPNAVTIHASFLHLDVAVLAQILQQVATLEVLVGMHNCFQLVRSHHAFVLGLLDLCLVQVLEDTNISVSRYTIIDMLIMLWWATYRLQAMWYF